MKTLVLGGVRSGKSRFGETLAQRSRLPVTYIATATAGDAEMQARIAAHRLRRPTGWTLVEEPRALTQQLRRHAAAGHCVIVDCLTLWLTQLLMDGDKSKAQHTCHELAENAETLPGEIILIGNETNLGIIPTGALSRDFCDLAGTLHQELARRCERVVFMVAGLPWVVKGNPL